MVPRRNGSANATEFCVKPQSNQMALQPQGQSVANSTDFFFMLRQKQVDSYLPALRIAHRGLSRKGSANVKTYSLGLTR